MFTESQNTFQSFNNYFKDGETTNDKKAFSLGKQKREIFVNENIPGPTDVKNCNIVVFP